LQIGVLMANFGRNLYELFLDQELVSLHANKYTVIVRNKGRLQGTFLVLFLQGQSLRDVQPSTKLHPKQTFLVKILLLQGDHFF
jgi:hypothetical protein